MSEDPRQQPENVWAWIYLAVLESDREPADEKQKSIGVDARRTQGTPADSERK